MEKRNTILLTVIAIATLLVSVVGATFAYFVASTQTDGAGSSASTTTQKMNGANLNFTSTGEVLNMLDYPGGLGIYGATATISKQERTDANDYKGTFNLKITYTNLTNTDLEWELWMIKSKIGDLSVATDAGGFDKITTCSLKEQTVGPNTYYWYADVSDPNNNYNAGERCDAEAIRNAVKDASGSLIAYGDLKHGQTDKAITSSSTKEDESGIKYGETLSDSSDPIKSEKEAITNNQLGGRTLNTTTGEDSKVYYLVVKYPNNKDDQSTDAGKAISVKLEIDGEGNSVLYTPGD